MLTSKEKKGHLPWVVMLFALVFMLPTFCIVVGVFWPITDTWEHLTQTVLPDYFLNSLILFVGVGIIVLFMGTMSAWLVVMYQFPARRFFEWALVLPLAAPAYVLAYAYTDLLQYSGPVQTYLRDFLNIDQKYWFPQIRSIEGAIFVFSFSLYPYVYLLAKSAFHEQSISALEVSRTLRCSAISSFFKVAMPLARPTIVAGVALALMEALADFGTVSYFGVQTFTTGIYRAWLSMGDMISAIKLSACLLGFIVLLFLLERYQRSHAQYHQTSSKYKQPTHISLVGFSAWFVTILCSIPVLFGFFIPVVYLLYLCVDAESLWLSHYFELILNSFTLAAVTAFLAIIIALFFAYSLRIYRNKITKISIRMASFGYALPGSILAIGALIPLAWLDRQMNVFFKTHMDISLGLILSGSIFVLIFAYLVRFITISIHTLESSLDKVSKNVDI